MPASDAPRWGFRAAFGAAVVAFAAFGATYPPLSWWPLVPVAPALLGLVAVRARTARVAALAVLLGGLPAWLLLQAWTARVAFAGYPLFALACAAFAPLAVLVVRAAHRSGVPLTVAVPVAWIGMEAVRGEWAFDGYPWFLLGHPLIDVPVLAQSADLFGVGGPGLLVAALGGVLGDAALGSRRRAAVGAAAVLVLLAANAAYGAWRLGQDDVFRPGPRVLVIQTNLPQDNKIGWTPEAQIDDVHRFIDMTRAALDAAPGPVDVVVWPETMAAGLGFEPGTADVLRRFGDAFAHLVELPAAVEALARETGVPMLVGSSAWIDVHLEPVDGGWRLARDREHNSAYLVTGTPPYPRYDKVHLTPFGEVMPYIEHWPWLQERLLAIGARGMRFALSPAQSIERLVVPGPDGPVVVATPICYEDTVAALCRRLVGRGDGRAEVLVNLSNDGWFGDADGGRAQHNQSARFRAIEHRVPLVRAVNTGESIVADSRGIVVATIGAGRYGEARVAGDLWAALRLDRRTTLYGRIGELLPRTCAALMALLLVRAWWWRRRHGGHRDEMHSNPENTHGRASSPAGT